MENSYKINDVLKEYQEAYLKINKIELKLNEYYDRVAELTLVYNAVEELGWGQPSDTKKVGDMSTVIFNLYREIHVLKTDFINDILKNKADELDEEIVRDNLESYFKALNPFFIGINWHDCHRIVSERNNEIRNNPAIVNELKLKDKKARTNLIHVALKYSFDGGLNPLTKNLNENFKNIEKSSEGIYFINKGLEKLKNQKEELFKSKDSIIVTQEKTLDEIQKKIDEINLKIISKEERREKLEGRLERNERAINKKIAIMKKSNQDESLALDISKFLAKNKERARYSYNFKRIDREGDILYNKVNELIKQSIEDGNSDVSLSIENNNIIISDDQVDALELKEIDENILINTKNIYLTHKTENSDTLDHKLGLLHNEFFMLHHAKHNKITSNPPISNEINQKNLSLGEQILANAYEYYKKALISSDLKGEIKIIDEFNSAEKDKVLSYFEKNKILSMIDSWQTELNNDVLIEDVNISKVEVLSDSINGMTNQTSSSDNNFITQGVNQTFKFISNIFANNFNR